MVCETVVACQHGVMMLPQLGGELFCHADGAVLPARATNGDRQVTAMGSFELWDPTIQEADDVLKHRHELGLRLQECNNFLVMSIQSAKIYRPVWISQAAHVENEVRVGGNTVFETK